MKKEFVMRGQTADFKTTGTTEVLNFSGYKPGYAYRLTEFQIYPSTGIHTVSYELVASITAGKTPADPENPNFNDEGLIATAISNAHHYDYRSHSFDSIINDTFLITQNLIMTLSDISTAAAPINWQCRFESVKMSGAEEAAVNYKQFAISDE